MHLLGEKNCDVLLKICIFVTKSIAMSKKVPKEFKDYLQTLKAKQGNNISLANDFSTICDNKSVSEYEIKDMLKKSISRLAKMQDKLYAHDKYGILIVLQAMDAAGKDGAIKHVMKGLNPQGVKVWSFKSPNSIELDHNYFWRHYSVLPARGEISIFNRSHYENVLVTRVHPEYVVNEKLPGIEKPEDITPEFWNARYEQINRFEKNLYENGTIIIKFFLHISKEEQKNRFLERINNPAKNWKFSSADSKERKLWDSYMNVYEEMISATSTSDAPWYIIPADEKWFARFCIASIIVQETKKLNLNYPEVDDKKREELQQIKQELLNE